MKQIVIAVDSLKGSLSSMQAGTAVKEGFQKVFPHAKAEVRPIADGGEGTVEALVEGMDGRLEELTVTGPLGEPVSAAYGMMGENTAVMEMAAAAGLDRVAEAERNPLDTTTFGVGEMICHAMEKGCRHFIIGIGGSATNDGGIGMLQALGFELLDDKGEPVPFGAKGLEKLCRINNRHAEKNLSECTFQIACDVTNPLCGEKGASAVFGPQKGADAAMIEKMDAWLSRYADLAKNLYPHADKDAPGAGAAGGMGFAFKSFLKGKLVRGIDLIIKETALESYLQKADLVVTGEGRLDGQTAMGKAPLGVARLAKKYGVPTIAFSGCVTEGATVCNEHGIDAFFPIVRGACTLQEAMGHEVAYRNMKDTAEQVFRLIKALER